MANDLFSSDRIRTMIVVAERGSFSKAAADLGVSQSSISQQIKKIEHEIGRRLFDRLAHPLALTADGEAFLAFAQAMRSVGEASRRQFAQPRIQGSIRLGVLDEVARVLLAGVLGFFYEQFPGFELQASCDTSHQLAAEFDNDRYDIVVCRSQASRPRGELLQRMPLSWIGREDQRCPVPDPVPLVLPPAPDVLRDAALQALRESGRSWHIRFESSNLAAIEAAVRAGVGVSVLGSLLPLAGGMSVLGDAAALPPLPDETIVLQRRVRDGGDEGIDVICAIVRAALERHVRSARSGGARTQSFKEL